MNKEVARLGARNAAALTVTCEATERVFLVGMPPADREPVDVPADQVPAEIRGLVRDSRAKGYNLCAVRSDDLAVLKTGKKPDRLRWECRQVLAMFRQFVATTGNSFEIALARSAGGEAEILSLKAR
jgi:hypothetical protein